jgi:predicted DNA-binding protein YlxM (UPF0122 family)
MSGGLLWLGQLAIWKNPFLTRKRAIENCLKRTSDEQKRARLEHALRRVKTEESRQELVDAMTGELNGRRTNYN